MTRIVIDPGDLATMSSSLRSGAGDLSSLSSAVYCDTSCMPPSTAAMIDDVTTNASSLLTELVADLDALSADLATRAALATADASTGFTATGLGTATTDATDGTAGQTLIISNAQADAGATVNGGTLIISNALADANSAGPVVLVGGTGATNQPVDVSAGSGQGSVVSIGGGYYPGSTILNGSDAASAFGNTIIYTPPHVPLSTANVNAAVDNEIFGGMTGNVSGGTGGLNLTGLAVDTTGLLRSIYTNEEMYNITTAGGPSLLDAHYNYDTYSLATGIDASDRF